MRLGKTARITVAVVVCAGLIGTQQTAASADPGTCTLNQVASDPTGREFTDAAGLQDQLGAASGDDECTDAIVQFTTGVTLAGQELAWEGEKPLGLRGEGRTDTTIDAATLSRAVHMTSGSPAQLTVQNLTITDGAADNDGGGGILTNGSLVIEDSGIQSNTSPTVGGGIYAHGTTSISSSLVSSNSVTRSASDDAAGGGIYTSGNLTVISSTFANNEARNTGLGDARGGGIFVNTASLNMTDSQIIENAAVAEGDSASAYGGGVLASPGTITNSTIKGNVVNADYAADGSGVTLGGESVIENTTVTANIGQGANVGGAVNGPDVLTVTNSTVTNNSASATSNASAGIVVVNGLNLNFSTVANNVVDAGTPSGRDLNGGNQQLTLKGSVVANESGGACALMTLKVASAYNATTTGDASCGIQSSANPVTGTWDDLHLDSLRSNGGPTKTMALLDGSILADAIPNATGTTILGADGTDQRGVIRSDGGSPGNAFSIGAEQNATVSFDPNGGVGSMDPQSSIRPAALTANTFTRSGYQFDGWKTAPSSGTAYANEAEYPFNARTPENANATLYAQWSQVSAPTITSADATTATQGSAMDPFAVTTTAAPTVTSITEVPSGQQTGLPDGVSLMYSSGSSATISGTPTQAGTFTTTISARNGIDPEANQVFTLTVSGGSNTQALVPPGCANSSVPNGKSAVILTKAACQTTAGQVVGTRAAVNLTRGDVRGYELKCQTGKKLRAPRSLARYGRGYVYCPRGKLVLIGNGRPARVIVTWYAPAVGDYLAFKRVRTIRMR